MQARRLRFRKAAQPIAEQRRSTSLGRNPSFLETSNANEILNDSQRQNALMEERLTALLDWRQRCYLWYLSYDGCISEWESPVRVAMRAVIEHPGWQVWMLLITLWALFAEDLKIALTDRDSDDAFSAVTLAVFVCFMADLCLSCYCLHNFLFSFFFWLDLLSSLSLIFDVLFIAEPIGLREGSDDVSAGNTRAGRAARTGTRATRILRLMRLVRIGRLWKLAKQIGNNEKNESNLGSVVNNLIIQRIIVAVLLISLVLPFLRTSQDQDWYPLSTEVSQLSQVLEDPALTDAFRSEFQTRWIQDNSHRVEWKSLLLLEVNGTRIVDEQSDLKRLRTDEVETFEQGSIAVMYCSEAVAKADAWRNIGLICFLIAILALLAWLFTYDVNTHVLGPIDEMTVAIEQLIRDPLAPARQLNEQRREVSVKGEDETSETHVRVGSITEKSSERFETRMMTGTITRISRLLGMGFGLAGSSLISQSLQTRLGDSASKIGSARMVNAIFGFCDIRNFTDATECLQTAVMAYVNSIAGVVHARAVEYGGSANKNVGDAFLTVWPLEERLNGVLQSKLQSQRTESDPMPMSDDERDLEMVADQAMIAVLKIIIDILKRNQREFIEYRQNRRIRQRMGDEWEVSLGWGLHIGDSVEGALGSRFKIDTTYLSTHVNLAEDLEGATKFYAVPFLMSESFYRCLSPVGQYVSRKVDRIQIAGFQQPFSLYTCDLWKFHANKLSKAKFQGSSVRSRDRGFGSLSSRKNEIRELNQGREIDPRIEQLWFGDEEMDDLLAFTPLRAYVAWEQGMHHYLEGRWDKARSWMRATLRALPSDGASEALLGFMESHNFKAPHNWHGFRHFD